ncbi:hypothetical protein [Anthocerotibacter panamensis]|uniref:hypothetical protein n=1 Tax=Anthocerotibacter panamensis TaxID=2857077 RepID=UPI001C40180F|nr:hypothetical protein [Anthocerotibacter panamensis]
MKGLKNILLWTGLGAVLYWGSVHQDKIVRWFDQTTQPLFNEAEAKVKAIQQKRDTNDKVEQVIQKSK